MIRNDYASLICGLVIITMCWVGCAYVLVVNGELEVEPKQVSPEAASASRCESNANHCVDLELAKVLVEVDIRTPSPEHEAFLREHRVLLPKGK